jgi:hypothetical protein
LRQISPHLLVVKQQAKISLASNGFALD